MGSFQTRIPGASALRGLQPLVTATLQAVGAPEEHENYAGVHQAAAAIHEFAPEELKRRWLRPAFTNEEFWCQLFSEPGAGSDLAGLSTSAMRDGDEWVINGQKVWTSMAHRARWAILLARSDPNVPKHRGILTFFVLDMLAEGVDVRPLRTIDGARPFNEVFLTDVRIPDSYRLGDVGQGWGVSVFLLSSDKREGIADNRSPLPELLEKWQDRRALGSTEPVLRDRVASVYISNEIARSTTLRAKGAQGKGEDDTFAPLLKLIRNASDQEIYNLMVDLEGAYGTLGGDFDWEERGDAPSHQLRFLESRARSIAGGSAQIMLNLIGERILGLPSEQRLDKGIPWNATRRSV